MDQHAYSQRTQKILRVTAMGSLANALLVVVKLLVGIWGHSSALVAEAINSLSDFATDLIALVFIRISGKPQDEDHHYGHGKFETLASVVMALVMVSVGTLLCYRSGEKVLAILHGELTPTPPSRLALLVSLLALGIKLGLYAYTQRWALQLKSSALRAKALDHRGDTLALLAVILGLAGTLLLGERGSFLEPLAALVVSLFILRMGWIILRPAFNELTEKRLPAEVEAEIEARVLATPHVRGIHQLRTRSIGQCYAIELCILVDGAISVTAGHDITLVIEQELRACYGRQTYITIHVEPDQEASPTTTHP